MANCEICANNCQFSGADVCKCFEKKPLWPFGDVDSPSKLVHYGYFLREIIFDYSGIDDLLDGTSQMRERLNITTHSHNLIVQKLERIRPLLSKLSAFSIFFNFNCNDSYVGHDTFLDFNIHNLCESDSLKVGLHWRDSDKYPDQMFEADSGSYIRPGQMENLTATVTFEKVGVKDINGLIVTIINQFDEVAVFSVGSFRVHVGSLERSIVQNFSTTNSISIEGRGVIDATGMG